MGTPLCIDVSHHNHPIASFREAYDEDGIRLVIHKATQGRGFTDPKFWKTRNRLAEHLPAMKFGAYHFGDNRPVTAQVNNFLRVAKGVDLLVLDWEPNPAGGTMTTAQAEDFVSQVRARTGRWPMLYSGHTLKEARIGKASPLLKCELWLAQYSAEPKVPDGWKSRGFRLWQYTNGQVNAASGPVHTAGVGRVDRNIFNGSPEDFERWWAMMLAAKGR